MRRSARGCRPHGPEQPPVCRKSAALPLSRRAGGDEPAQAGGSDATRAKLVGGGFGRRGGADFIGERLNVVYRENITEAEILSSLDALFGQYARERVVGEGFGDFLVRAGVIQADARDPHIAEPNRKASAA